MKKILILFSITHISWFRRRKILTSSRWVVLSNPMSQNNQVNFFKHIYKKKTFLKKYLARQSHINVFFFFAAAYAAPVLGTLRFYENFLVCVPCAGDFEIEKYFPVHVDFECENIFPCVWALYWWTLSLKICFPVCGPCTSDFEFEDIFPCVWALYWRTVSMKIFPLSVGPVLGTLKIFSLCVGPVLRTLSMKIVPLSVGPVLRTFEFENIFPVCRPCTWDFEFADIFPCVWTLY